MNDTQIIDPAAIGRTFAEQLAYLSSNPPRAGALLYLLPPCLVLIAVDVAARLANRPRTVPETAQASAREEEVQELVGRVRDALAKFQALEKKLSTEKARSKHLARMLRKQQNFTLHRQKLAALEYPAENGMDDCPPSPPMYPPPKKSEVRYPFHVFCQQLVLQNRIWKQQRDVKRLRDNLATMRTSNRHNAFQAFCDRLLLSNKIWAQEKAVSSLVDEAEMLKRSRGFVVARAAEKMALDVEKERLTEEYVKDLLNEVESCRHAVETLRVEHEQEVIELAQDWREDCRRLAREVERLELSRAAHLAEQTLSNAQETELIERLAIKTAALNPIDEEPALESPQSAEFPRMDDDTYYGSELESNTSASTCVGSAGFRTPNQKRSFDEGSSGRSSRRNSYHKQKAVPLPALKLLPRRRSMSIILSPTASSTSTSPIRKLEAGPYAGFSFNPLFFGSPSNASSYSGEHRSDASAGRVRTYSLQSPTPHDRSRTYSLQSDKRGAGTRSALGGREPPKRAQWRL